MIFHLIDQLSKMSNVNWSELNELDANLAWSVLTSEISDKFFDGTLLAVPTIKQASYYDLMACFSKIKKSKYRLHGQLNLNLASGGKMDEKFMEKDLNTESFSHTWSDGDHSVKITLEGVKKLVMNWDMEGSLVIDHNEVDFRKKSVYVISEVVTAAEIIVELQLFYTKNVYHFDDKQTPVAFSYLEFPVDENGILQDAKDTKLDMNAVFEPIESTEPTEPTKNLKFISE